MTPEKPKRAREDPRERRKNERCGRRGKKSAELLAPQPFEPHPSGSHPSAPTFSGFGPTLRGPHPWAPTPEPAQSLVPALPQGTGDPKKKNTHHHTTTHRYTNTRTHQRTHQRTDTPTHTPTHTHTHQHTHDTQRHQPPNKSKKEPKKRKEKRKENNCKEKGKKKSMSTSGGVQIMVSITGEGREARRRSLEGLLFKASEGLPVKGYP